MAFWSSEHFLQRGADHPLVTPYAPQHIMHGAYELAVGPEVSITSKNSTLKQTLTPGESFAIPSGQFALLLTEEIVNVPLTALGLISIRASIKFEGLVNVSGFHVDPGFIGRLKFSVYNAGSKNIVLSRGQRVFMLWFGDLDRQTSDGYGGERPQHNEITSTDLMRMQGHIASPAQLQKDIIDLGHSVTNLKYVVGVFSTIATALIVGLTIAILRVGIPALDLQPSADQVPSLTNSTRKGQAERPSRPDPSGPSKASPSPGQRPLPQ